MKKIMGLWDLVFMNIAAIVGLRWMPIAAGYGAAAIPLWIIAALLFFIPLGLVSTELATTWPDEGGLYVWIKKAYGDRLAFLVSWFYWTNTFFFLPALLTFIAVTFSFLINPALATNKTFICTTVLTILWGSTLVNIRGLRLLKWVANIGGTCGVLLPGLIIAILALSAVFIWHRPIQTDYSWSQWLPHLGSESNIAFLSTLMFSMAGIELTPIIAGETREPQKTFPRAVFISAIIIVCFYILGTVMLTWMIAPEKIGAASGIMDAFSLITKEFHLPYLVAGVALLIVLGGIGGANVWSVVPLKMFLESTKEGIMPKYFTHLNNNDMPNHTLILQSSIISVIVITTAFLPSVNMFYEILVLMATIVYFIPYLVMFLAFIKLRKTHANQYRPYKIPGNNLLAYTIAIIGFCSVALAIMLPFLAPPKDIINLRDLIFYRIEVASGPILFFILGYVLYAIYEHRMGIVKRKWLSFLAEKKI